MASSPLPRADPAFGGSPAGRSAAPTGLSPWRPTYNRLRLIAQAAASPQALLSSLTTTLDGPGLTLGARWCTHACLLLFVAGLALASRIDLRPILAQEAGDVPSRPAYQTLSIGPDLSSQGFLIKAAVPITIIPERPRDEWLIYTVQEYDTVWNIAESQGLTPETLYWSNADLREDLSLLSIGQELRVPPADGLVHEVEEGDTLEGLAETYEVTVEDIRSSPLNEKALALGGPLSSGFELFIPGGYKELPRPKPVVQAPSRVTTAPAPRAVVGTARFGWPTAATRVTQWYWWGHRALDIAGPAGTPVYAADAGCVVVAGWSNVGYGYHLIIDHGNGFQTLYAHLSAWYVDPGRCVAKGAFIGAIGATGRSTGPHLHFEIRQGGWLHNPWEWIF